MKKIFLKFVMLITCLLFISCEDGKEKIYIYSWAGYIPSTIYENFEKETGIKIIEDIYSSNEEMYTKIKSGGDGYDLVLPSSDYLEIMSKQDLLEKLDKSKLTGLENISDVVFEKMKLSGNISDYGVPYMMIPTVIAVNKNYVKDYKRDYSIFDREDLAGRMTMLDDMREIMTVALDVNGYKQDNDSDEALEAAKKTILNWKKNIVKFDSESFGKGFANGDFVVVQGYPDNISSELTKEQLNDVDFIIPDKGGFSAIDSLAILKSSKNKENAYKFLEYLLRPEVAAEISSIFHIPSINKKAYEMMDFAPLYNIEDLEKTQVLIDIGPKLYKHNQYWQSILIDN